MRAGIGLVGLLVAVALLMWLFAESEIPKVRAGKKAQEDVQQISGRGADGVAATESFETEGKYNGSRLDGLVVTSVTAGGAMQAYYGLAVDDRITAVNGVRVNDASNGDDQLAKALVAEAFQRQQPLTVVRNGQTLTLPGPPSSGNATPAPAGQAPGQSNSVYDQIQNIGKAAGEQGGQAE